MELKAPQEVPANAVHPSMAEPSSMALLDSMDLSQGSHSGAASLVSATFVPPHPVAEQLSPSLMPATAALLLTSAPTAAPPSITSLAPEVSAAQGTAPTAPLAPALAPTPMPSWMLPAPMSITTTVHTHHQTVQPAPVWGPTSTPGPMPFMVPRPDHSTSVPTGSRDPSSGDGREQLPSLVASLSSPDETLPLPQLWKTPGCFSSCCTGSHRV